jgi:hypothetical protein
MGAYTFYTLGTGPTLAEAFRVAVADAAYEHGHGGYTGTLAEKDEVVEIPAETSVTPEKQAEQLVQDDDARISDKWGPAGAIKVAENEWLFFGLASS